MRRLVAHDPHFQAVYVTPDYSIYRWLPPPARRGGPRQRVWGDPAARPAGAGLRDRVYRGRRDHSGRPHAEDNHPDQIARPPRHLPRRPPRQTSRASPAPWPLARVGCWLARRAASAWRTYVRSVSSERRRPGVGPSPWRSPRSNSGEGDSSLSLERPVPGGRFPLQRSTRSGRRASREQPAGRTLSPRTPAAGFRAPDAGLKFPTA